MDDDNSILPPPKRTPWNKGKLIGAETSRSLKYPGRADIALPDC
jgi:hypothetical protein